MTLSISKGHDGPPAKPLVILALEASGDLLAAAVWADGAVQNHQAHAARHGHAAHIATLVEQVMKTAAVTLQTSPMSLQAGVRGHLPAFGWRLLQPWDFVWQQGLRVWGSTVLRRWLGIVIAASLFWFRQKRVGVRCYAQCFDSDGSALTPILETTTTADIAASLPAGLSELVIAGWQADELLQALWRREVAFWSRLFMQCQGRCDPYCRLCRRVDRSW